MTIKLYFCFVVCQVLMNYLCICNRSRFIDGGHLQNEILTHMSRLHTFTFSLSTHHENNVPTVRLSSDDLQRTFTHVGIGPVACTTDYSKVKGFLSAMSFLFHSNLIAF